MDFGAALFFLALAPAWAAWALSPAAWRLPVMAGLSLAFLAAWRQWDVLLALPALALLAWSLGPALRPGARRPSVALAAGLGVCLALFVSGKAAADLAQRGAWLGTVGVSYFTLQAGAYLADVRLGQQEPEADPLGLFIFLAWFPKLVQGPFERCGPFLERVRAAAALGPRGEDLRRGLWLLGWGLFEKAVVAARAQGMAEGLARGLPDGGFPRLALLAAAFTTQLYADFSGYTDMALGCSALFGVGLSPNFRAPLLATSVADYWRRWHLSFSDWIRDYLFVPLQMGLRSTGGWATPLALALGFQGVALWHGLGAGYRAFYALQTVAMTLALLTAKARRGWWRRRGLESSGLRRAWQGAFMLAYIGTGNLLFWAADRRGLGLLADSMGRGWASGWAALGDGAWRGGLEPLDLGVLALGVVLMSAPAFLPNASSLLQRPRWQRYPAYAGLAAVLLLFGRYFAAQGFLYARF